MTWCPSTLQVHASRQAERPPDGESPAGSSKPSPPAAIQRWPLRIYAHFEASPRESAPSDDSIRDRP